MGSDEKWYFTKEQLENSPSRQCGIDSSKELSYRQQAANFIQELGQKLKVSQLCMNTAIVYMHRFYVFHSFTHFPWSSIAAAALFLSAKVEEQPRKVEHVIKIAYHCKNHKEINFEGNPEKFQLLSQDLVFNENILLQTLGFDVAIDHPHTHIVRCCHLVRAGKDLAQTSYFMASNSLHLTTMCLQYKPTVVACFCIHLACKWSRWEIPLSNEKKEWFSYIDPMVTIELLEQLTEEFLNTFEKCSSRLKEKIMSIGGGNMSSMMEHHWSHNHLHHPQQSNSPLEDKKPETSEAKETHPHRPPSLVPHHHGEGKSGMHDDQYKQRTMKMMHDHGIPTMQQSQPLPQRDREKEYRERKERERLNAQHPSVKLPPPHPASSSGKQPVPPHHYHKQHSRPPLPPSSGRQEPRDILREAAKKEQVRVDRDAQKRDYLLKPNVTDTNSLNNYPSDAARLNYNSEKQQRMEQHARSSSSSHAKMKPHDPNAARRYEDAKSEAERQKHLQQRDKNGAAYVSAGKSGVHPAQKPKPPYPTDSKSSVPKLHRPEVPHNGHSSSAGSVPTLIDDKCLKQEIKEEPFTVPIKKPSLFSPEKSPPYKKPGEIKPEPPDYPVTSTMSSYAPTVTPSSYVDVSNRRPRTSSSSSDAELRPVMPKIDQVEGFENLMRDSSIEINKLHQIPDIITPITDKKAEKHPELQPASISKELRPPDLIPPFSTVALQQPLANGIETDPTLISNLLKETPTVPHLPAVVAQQQQPAAEFREKEHHHKERKKKNKEKHKHKDKDRNREDKEKKKKHKDKDREKHKNKHALRDKEPQPIRITIQKDKIQLPSAELPPPPIGLKIKIPKDRIRTESIAEVQQTPSSGGLKIKIPIPKEAINNYTSEPIGRKRERTSPAAGPPAKLPKQPTSTSSSSSSTYAKYAEAKQNGRHKVSGAQQTTALVGGIPHFNKNAPPPQHLYHPPQQHFIPPSQQHFYYYPTNMTMPPPPYMYHQHQQQYYGAGFVYPAAVAAVGGVGGVGAPPLPMDAPPDVPPPPPPE